jgi:hypothetical protein
MGGWRKYHSEKLHNLYSSPIIIRIIKSRRIRRACSMHGEDEISIQNFGWKA